VKRGSSPAASGCVRRTRAQKPWIVPTQEASTARACSGSPSAWKRRRIRSRSSAAAFSVNVSVRIEPTARPSWRTASTKRSTITAVLPDPAPAASSDDRSRSPIAARCSGVQATAAGVRSASAGVTPPLQRRRVRLRRSTPGRAAIRAGYRR
jgi:hypothetical protein